ncbi:MAG TPA: TolC family protein [bacterium]|nr:TolC family protein [bacterium]HPS29261.1 TolC family protein [bacterium]
MFPLNGQESSVPAANSEKNVVDRDEFIKIFVEKAEIVDSFRYKIQSAQADYDKVLAQYFPKMKMVFGLGPHPKYEYERAGIQKDDDGEYYFKESNWDKHYYDFSEYGVAIRINGEMVMPVFTFGKIKNGLDASKANIEVKKAESIIGEAKVRKEAALYYWSWVMVNEILSFMEPAIAKVDEAEGKLKEMLYEEKEGVRQKDLIKLRIEKEKLAYNLKKLQLQKDTLKSVLDAVLGDNWILADSTVTAMKFEKTYDEIVDFTFNSSPYSKMMQNGLSAYEHLYHLEICRLLPDFGFAGSFSYKYTSSVYEKNYPNPDSPYNGWDGEVGIGLSINLNFVEQGRNVQKAKAEWNAFKSQTNFLKKTYPLQIKEKYNDLKSLESQIFHIGKARKYAKGWMTSEFGNYESGFNGPNDLIDSVKLYFENELLYIQSVFDYNMKIEEINEMSGMR